MDSAHRMIADLGLEQTVHLLGWVSGAAKMDLLHNATAFVLPSYLEGIPMGVLEAMSVGVPVVTTPVGGIPDAIENGQNGFLVEPGDDGAIADAIVQLVTDESLRHQLARRAKDTVDTRFSPQTVLPHLDSLFRRYGLEPAQ